MSGLCQVSPKVTNLDLLIEPITNRIRDVVIESSIPYWKQNKQKQKNANHKNV